MTTQKKRSRQEAIVRLLEHQLDDLNGTTNDERAKMVAYEFGDPVQIQGNDSENIEIHFEVIDFPDPQRN
jgi:hypothetical protein